MGMIGRILGSPAATGAIGKAASGIAEVFTENATKKMEGRETAYLAALAEFGTEFQSPANGFFDRFVNGLNRLPRPLLALGTLALFAFAMFEPEGFGRRMVGLNLVPDPLWWLLAAVVGFYFGAREAHYFRARPVPVAAAATGAKAVKLVRRRDNNAALDEWRKRQR